jgi:hypothetical protein
MKITKDRLISMVREVAAGELGGPGSTQYMAPDGGVASAPDPDDEFRRDMADRASADVAAYIEDRKEREVKLGEFEGNRGDPYTYDWDRAAKSLTKRRKKLYITAATKHDPDHKDADPMSGHYRVGKTFEIPVEHNLHAEFIEKYGDEINPLIQTTQKVAQVTGGSSSSSSDSSSSDSLDSLPDIFESKIQPMVRQAIIRKLISEGPFAPPLETKLNTGMVAKSAKEIDDIIDEIGPVADARRESLKSLVIATLSDRAQKLRAKEGSAAAAGAEDDAVTGAPATADADAPEKPAEVEHGNYSGGTGDPYTYAYAGKVKMRKCTTSGKDAHGHTGQMVPAILMTAVSKTDKKTGDVTKVDKKFYLCDTESGLGKQLKSNKEIKADLKTLQDAQTAASVTGATDADGGSSESLFKSWTS